MEALNNNFAMMTVEEMNLVDGGTWEDIGTFTLTGVVVGAVEGGAIGGSLGGPGGVLIGGAAGGAAGAVVGFFEGVVYSIFH